MKSLRLYCISITFLSLVFIPSLMVAFGAQKSDQDDRSYPTIALSESFTGLAVSNDGRQALVWKQTKMDTKATLGGKGHAVGKSGNSIALVDLEAQKVLKATALGFDIFNAVVDENFIYVVSAEEKQCHVLNKTTLQEKAILKVGRFISHIESDNKILSLNNERFKLPGLKKTTSVSRSSVVALLNVTDVSAHRSSAGITSIQAVSLLPVDRHVFVRPKRELKAEELKPKLFMANVSLIGKTIPPISARVVGWKQGGGRKKARVVGLDVYAVVNEQKSKTRAKRPEILETIVLSEEKSTHGPKTSVQMAVHGSKVVVLADDQLFIWDGSDYTHKENKKPLVLAKSKPKLLKTTGTTTVPIKVIDGGNGPYKFELLEACKGVTIDATGNIVVNNEEVKKDCQSLFIKRVGKQFSKVTNFDKSPVDYVAWYEEKIATPVWKMTSQSSRGLPVKISVRYLVTDKDARIGKGELQLFVGVDKKEVTDSLQKFYVDIPWVVEAKKKAAESKRSNMSNQFRKGLEEFQAEFQRLSSEERENLKKRENAVAGLDKRLKILEERMDRLSKQMDRIEKLLTEGKK